MISNRLISVSESFPLLLNVYDADTPFSGWLCDCVYLQVSYVTYLLPFLSSSSSSPSCPYGRRPPGALGSIVRKLHERREASGLLGPVLQLRSSPHTAARLAGLRMLRGLAGASRNRRQTCFRAACLTATGATVIPTSQSPVFASGGREGFISAKADSCASPEDALVAPDKS